LLFVEFLSAGSLNEHTDVLPTFIDKIGQSILGNGASEEIPVELDAMDVLRHGQLQSKLRSIVTKAMESLGTDHPNVLTLLNEGVFLFRTRNLQVAKTKALLLASCSQRD
jgi:hypothetical protein